jgi:hypothetical protein
MNAAPEVAVSKEELKGSSGPRSQFQAFAIAQPGFTFTLKTSSNYKMKRSAPILPCLSIFESREDLKHCGLQAPVAIEQQSIFTKLGHVEQDPAVLSPLQPGTITPSISSPCLVMPSQPVSSDEIHDEKTLTTIARTQAGSLLLKLTLPSYDHDGKLLGYFVQIFFYEPQNIISTKLLSWCQDEAIQRC